MKANGSVFIYILVGVALFAALMFSLSRSLTSSSTPILGKGQTKLSANRIAEYTRSIDMAIEKLQLRGCSFSQISYETPDGSNVNINAPADKTCHVFHIRGGGVIYDPLLTNVLCPLTSLAVGESCYGIVYGGTSGGRRIYTTLTDLPANYPYNNGSYIAGAPATGATSDSDGLSNTQILVVATGIYAPYRAARACAALGAKWYLPAKNEMADLYSRRNTGDLKFQHDDFYYNTSTEIGGNNNWTIRQDPAGPINRGNTLSLNVRCVRRD